jgi:hypothetical protein
MGTFHKVVLFRQSGKLERKVLSIVLYRVDIAFSIPLSAALSVSLQTKILSGKPGYGFVAGVQICLPVTPSIVALVLFSPLCRGYRNIFPRGKAVGECR